MKKIKKILLILCALIFILIIGLLVFVKIYINPETVKKIVETQVVNFTGRKLEIQNASLSIFSNIEFENLKFYDKNNRTPQLKIERLIVYYSLTGIFQGEFKITSIKIINPTINLSRTKQGFDFNDILKKLKLAFSFTRPNFSYFTASTKNIFNPRLTVKDIRLVDGVIDYQDNVENIKVNLCKFNLSARLNEKFLPIKLDTDFSINNAKVALNYSGNFFESYTVRLQIEDLNPDCYKKLYMKYLPKGLFLEKVDTCNIDLQLEKNRQLLLNGKMNCKKLTGYYYSPLKVTLTNLTFIFKNLISDFPIKFEKLNVEALDLKSNLDIFGISANFSGKFKGSIESPSYDITLNSNINLKNFQNDFKKLGAFFSILNIKSETIQSIVKLNKNLELDGALNLKSNFKGKSFKMLDGTEINSALTLKKLNLNYKPFPVDFQNSDISLKLNGIAKNVNKFDLNAILKSGSLTINSKFLPQPLRISSLNSIFTLKDIFNFSSKLVYLDSLKADFDIKNILNFKTEITSGAQSIFESLKVGLKNLNLDLKNLKKYILSKKFYSLCQWIKQQNIIKFFEKIKIDIADTELAGTLQSNIELLLNMFSIKTFNIAARVSSLKLNSKLLPIPFEINGKVEINKQKIEIRNFNLIPQNQDSIDLTGMIDLKKKSIIFQAKSDIKRISKILSKVSGFKCKYYKIPEFPYIGAGVKSNLKYSFFKSTKKQFLKSNLKLKSKALQGDINLNFSVLKGKTHIGIRSSDFNINLEPLLKELKHKKILPVNLKAKGSIKTDLSVQGIAPHLTINLDVIFNVLKFYLPFLKYAIEIKQDKNSSVKIKSNTLYLKSISILLDKSILKLDGTIKNLNSKPVCDLKFSSSGFDFGVINKYFNLNNILKLEGTGIINGKINSSILSPVVNLDLNSKKINLSLYSFDTKNKKRTQFANFYINNLKTHGSYKNFNLLIASLTSNLCKGKLSAKGKIKIKTLDSIFNFKLNKAKIRKILGSFKGFPDSLTGLADLSGKISFNSA